MPKSPQEELKDRKKILLQIAGVGLSMGSELIVCAFLGIYIGKYLDQKFELAPYGTLISVLFFLGASLTHIFIILLRFQKKLNKSEDLSKLK